MTENYNWTDNPTLSGIAECNTDVLNDCLMHLKYSQQNANQDLSNLTETGEKHFLGKPQITNCLLEVPQRIKLELNNGTLTLKAGSEVIVPNGKNADGSLKFDYVTVESDKAIPSGTTTAGQRFIWFTLPNGYGNGVTQYCFSGNTAVMNSTTPNTYSTFYNTETNKMYRGNGTTWVEKQYSLPVCLATNDATGAFTSIDQVFNGFGYIGSAIWVDKGVKGLAPNGWNGNGTYKNIEYATDKLITYTRNLTYANAKVYVNTNGSLSLIGTSEYNEEKNMNYVPSTGQYFEAFPIATCDVSSGVISNFQPKLPFRAVDYNDKSEIGGWGMPSSKYIDLTLGASGTTYTAPANGWFTFYGINGVNNGLVQMICNSAAFMSRSSYTGNSIAVSCPCPKGTSVEINYDGIQSTAWFRFVYAEGEV